MIDFKQIYAAQAEAYERLVAHEDYQGNLLPALREIRPFSGQTVVELGAGTGRLTRLIAPHVHQLTALDNSAHMLARAADSVRFFFGDGLADQILTENSAILPECTGIWWKVF